MTKDMIGNVLDICQNSVLSLQKNLKSIIPCFSEIVCMADVFQPLLTTRGSPFPCFTCVRMGNPLLRQEGRSKADIWRLIFEQPDNMAAMNRSMGLRIQQVKKVAQR
jgi:hypothetical protein